MLRTSSSRGLAAIGEISLGRRAFAGEYRDPDQLLGGVVAHEVPDAVKARAGRLGRG